MGVQKHQVVGLVTVDRAAESIGDLRARNRHVQDMAGPVPPGEHLPFWRFVERAEVLIDEPRGAGFDVGEMVCHGFLRFTIGKRLRQKIRAQYYRFLAGRAAAKEPYRQRDEIQRILFDDLKDDSSVSRPDQPPKVIHCSPARSPSTRYLFVDRSAVRAVNAKPLACLKKRANSNLK